MTGPAGTTVEEGGDGFGARLRRAREAAGLSQEELAERAGLSPNAVGGLERGEHRHPYPATLRALASALGLSDAERAALADTVPQRGQSVAPANVSAARLPSALFPLVGRERAVADACTLLRRDDVRLVTLTGPGGVGKTRLALQVASDLAGDFTHGAAFVSLAAIRDPALVGPTIARILGVVEGGGRAPVDRLGDALRGRHLLLVLDNYEQVLTAAALVTDLLGRCPRLKVLVTSRAGLRLDGERIFPVPPLEVPDPERRLTVEQVIDVAAVRLFADRALGANPAFTLTDGNVGAVVAVCHRLDGLPLAIELAAARSTLFAPEAMLPLLARRLPLLTSGRRDAPDRHQTMRHAIAWSHDLLTSDQQALFRRLAVFVGGFSLEAAETICGQRAEGPSSSPATGLDSVAALADASLLRHEPGPGGVPRYLMLETVREFGLEQLAAADEDEDVQDAHAAYFAGLDYRLDPNRIESGELFDDRLLRIEADHPNCRAALAHMAATGDAAGVLRLAGALADFWHHRGHLREGRQWLEWALGRAAAADPLWRGRALAGLSLVVWSQGDGDGAEPPAKTALAIARETGDLELTALSLHLLGMIERVRDRLDTAELLMQEARVRWRAFGTPTNEAWSLTNLSAIARQRGDVQTSARLVEEALGLFRTAGHASGTAMALSNVAELAADRGDDGHAVTAYQEAVHHWASIGERWRIARALSGLAALAAGHGQPEQAATLIGAADARLSECGTDLLPGDRRLCDRATATARAALGPERFAAQRDAGRALPYAAALAVAEAVFVPEPPSYSSISAPPSSSAGTLTDREHDAFRQPVDKRSRTRAT